jgi:hypothetical protein
MMAVVVVGILAVAVEALLRTTRAPRPQTQVQQTPPRALTRTKTGS